MSRDTTTTTTLLDGLAHLEAEIAECIAEAKADKHGSRSWWLARHSGLAHALDLVRGKQ